MKTHVAAVLVPASSMTMAFVGVDKGGMGKKCVFQRPITPTLNPPNERMTQGLL